MVEMLQEAGVKIFLHCMGVDAIVDGPTVKGAVFESKSSRQAILAEQVVDATGDGDVFAAAGPAYEHIQFHIGLVCRIGNLDKVDQAKAKRAKRPRRLGAPTPIEGVNWVNMHGPDGDALDVADLTKMELEHRRQIWKDVQQIRKTPGYEKVYLVETGPQLGVRMSRLLAGVERLTFEDVRDGRRSSRTSSEWAAIGGRPRIESASGKSPTASWFPRRSTTFWRRDVACRAIPDYPTT